MNSWRSAGVRAAQWVARLRRESSAKSKSSFATVRIARRRSTVFALVFKSGSVQDLQHRIDRFMNVIGGGSRRGGSDRPQHEQPGHRDPNESRHDPHAPSPRPVALWDLGRRAIVALRAETSHCRQRLLECSRPHLMWSSAGRELARCLASSVARGACRRHVEASSFRCGERVPRRRPQTPKCYGRPECRFPGVDSRQWVCREAAPARRMPPDDLLPGDLGAGV